MKYIYALLLIISNCWIGQNACAQGQYEKYFENYTLRLDYTQAGNSESQIVNFEQLRKEAEWAGPRKNLIDPFNYGQYRLMVYDSATQKLIFSRGYSTLFREWLDTPEATMRNRNFYETVVMPFPKNAVIVSIEKRQRDQTFKEIMRESIDPKSIYINKEQALQFPIKSVVDNGSPTEKIDVVVIPEGYTKSELGKFESDTRRFIDDFFETEPFKNHSKDFNFHLVMIPSEESGTDIPGKGIWKNTALNTSFYTFESERYLTTQDIKRVRDVAGLAPYDQIYILVNTEKYGGGGVYNYYNLCSSDHQQSLRVFTHEFGHAFGSLADEYAYGYSDPEHLYDLSVEPYEPNITTLADFASKWKDLTKKRTPIPTPDTKKYADKVGAFEGAGYVKTKIYRPVKDCKMRSNNTNDFCPVCTRSLIKMIDFYADRPVK
ncbi:hypothetical protein FUAX_22890 [Fulvitalea axinellae]|uniref:Peptidase M64 N-terminal domain-containing protein n=1 Tax=Fulvitalea axinellae TaxID=1182444 RepID=A0AAU9CSB8_9BACT|nr:hypothetical protein FUAX_22890 [Fulvitalea axinellae]